MQVLNSTDVINKIYKNETATSNTILTENLKYLVDNADYIKALRIVSGTLPLRLKFLHNIKYFTLTGNTVNNKGVGNETYNLVDKSKVKVGWYSSGTTQIILDTLDGSIISVKVKPNTTYTLKRKYFGISSERNSLIFTAVEPTEARTTYNRIVNRPYTEESTTFTTGNNDNYVNIMFARSATESEIAEMADNLMIYEGTENKQYVPYGYDIPIICGGKTTHIYIKSPLMTGDMLYSDGFIKRADESIEPVEIPEIQCIKGVNIFDVNTNVKPLSAMVVY